LEGHLPNLGKKAQQYRQNHHFQRHEIHKPDLSRDLVSEYASSNQINSLVSLIFLLRMLGWRINSKQYYQNYCEETYGNPDSVSCLQKLAQDSNNKGLHFSETIELFDGTINHFRTRRSPRFRMPRIKLPKFKVPKSPKFPRNRSTKIRNSRLKRPSKNVAGTGSPSSKYLNTLNKPSREILNKLIKKKPKKGIPSKPTWKKTKWDSVMKNRNQGKCAKNRCIDQDDSSKPKPNKADIYGELGTQVIPQLGDILSSRSSNSLGQHSGTKSSGRLRDIEHQKWDITKIKNFGTNINPPNGGKNVNGGVNIHKGNFPKENVGGSRPSLISRFNSKYLCNGGHRISPLSRFKRSNNRCPPNQRKGQKKPEEAKSNSPNPQQPKKDDPSSSSNDRPDIENPPQQGNKQQAGKQPGSKGDKKHKGDKEYKGGDKNEWHVHEYSNAGHIKLGPKPSDRYKFQKDATNDQNYKKANDAYKHLLRLRKDGKDIPNYYQLKSAIEDKKRQYRTLPGAQN